jgi:hypothetical protein
MRQLYDAGFADGAKGPGQWLSEPPKVDRYEKLAKN